MTKAPSILLLVLLLTASAVSFSAAPLHAQGHGSERFDPVFRKYSKRFFGVGFDWRVFKAQGMAESNLDTLAHSWVGARGIMQLMPSTFLDIQSHNPEFTAIDDPEWNIAAGILHDRSLWKLWAEQPSDSDRRNFMFASYNAGRTTILRAQGTAQARALDHRIWQNIERVAPEVQRWRYQETLGYVHKIEGNFSGLDSRGDTARHALPTPQLPRTTPR
ncbi:MAG: transglycosylase SLT domain-containing protein [Gemmatimonadota bacterium]